MKRNKKQETLCWVFGRVETEFYLEHYDIALLELENAREIIEKALVDYNKKNG